MNELPLWAAIPVAILVVAGGVFAIAGAIGLVRLGNFYQRLHAPALTTSGATICIVLASMLGFSVLNGRPVLHELVVGFFIMCTTPVTLMLLGRASLYRDRAANRPLVAPTDPLAVPPTTPDQEEPRS